MVGAISPVRLDSCNLEDSGCNQAYRLAPHDKGTIQSILQVVISGPPALVEYVFVGGVCKKGFFDTVRQLFRVA